MMRRTALGGLLLLVVGGSLLAADGRGSMTCTRPCTPGFEMRPRPARTLEQPHSGAAVIGFLRLVTRRLARSR